MPRDSMWPFEMRSLYTEILRGPLRYFHWHILSPKAKSADVDSPAASITTWVYGDVAEMLHVGRYSAEEPDINRLRKFIDSQGYRVVGDHEEEYVKGPGMMFAGDFDTYLTIIRLRVEKAARPTSIDN
jgi:hypothetical protein